MMVGPLIREPVRERMGQTVLLSGGGGDNCSMSYLEF